MLEELSKKIGFTQTEIKVVLFIISILILGFSFKTFFPDKNQFSPKIYDYSGQNELFNNYEDKELISDSLKSSDKKVDYKQEVLDFNTQSFKNIQKKNIPAEKSININKASLADLTKLPGIGEKTAQRIIDYRNTVKKFKTLNELINVKGIGDSKFEKIKKYIFID